MRASTVRPPVGFNRQGAGKAACKEIDLASHPAIDKVLVVRDGGAVTVRLSGAGTTARVPASSLRMNPRAVPGARVECYWDGDRCFYAGRVVDAHESKEAVSVLYDDGTFDEFFPLGLVRLLLPDGSAPPRV